MGLFNLCLKDPLLTTLKDIFHATPIKIPEERYQPLCVIARYNQKDKFIGIVTNLLTNTTVYPNTPSTSQMADVSGSKSKTVDFKLGFDIMDSFLKGMGISGGAIKENFSGITKVSFSFQNVVRHYFDIGSIGNFLKGKKFDKTNPATGFFFNENATCIVIDSTINSNNFSLHIEETSQNDFKLNIPAIQQILGNFEAGISAKQEGDLTISFSGKRSLAFAFSTIVFSITEDGIITFARDDFEAYSNKELLKGLFPVITPDRVFLYKEVGMVEFDN